MVGTKKTFTKNDLLVMKNIRRVESFLNGSDVSDNKCKNLTGVKIEQLKQYFQSLLPDEESSLENIKKHWDLTFLKNPYSCDMKTSIVRDGCFYYENIVPKLHKVVTK